MDEKRSVQDKIIEQSFGGDIDLYKSILEADSVGEPVYKLEDMYTPHVFDRLLRFFMLKKNVTRLLLKKALFSYYRYMGILDSSAINTHWTNLQKMIGLSGNYGNKNGLTYTHFQHIISNILGYSIVDVKLTLYNSASKETIEVSSAEINKYLSEQQINKGEP